MAPRPIRDIHAHKDSGGLFTESALDGLLLLAESRTVSTKITAAEKVVRNAKIGALELPHPATDFG
jgi:hypothetical protein